MEASGPPSVVVVKATALPFSSSIRQTKKTKAWESYTLSGIANQMAGQNGMKCMYEAASNPSYDRIEQNKQSDIKLLERLCKDAGLAAPGKRCGAGAVSARPRQRWVHPGPH